MIVSHNRSGTGSNNSGGDKGLQTAITLHFMLQFLNIQPFKATLTPKCIIECFKAGLPLVYIYIIASCVFCSTCVLCIHNYRKKTKQKQTDRSLFGQHYYLVTCTTYLHMKEMLICYMYPPVLTYYRVSGYSAKLFYTFEKKGRPFQ